MLRPQVVTVSQALSRFSWGLRRFLFLCVSLHCSWWHREAATLKSLPASTQNYTEPPFSVMARFSNQFPSWKAGIHLHPPHPQPRQHSSPFPLSDISQTCPGFFLFLPVSSFCPGSCNSLLPLPPVKSLFNPLSTGRSEGLF